MPIWKRNPCQGEDDGIDVAEDVLKIQEMQKFFLMLKFLKTLILVQIIFVPLHHLIDHVVKGGYGIVERRSLLCL